MIPSNELTKWHDRQRADARLRTTPRRSALILAAAVCASCCAVLASQPSGAAASIDGTASTSATAASTTLYTELQGSRSGGIATKDGFFQTTATTRLFLRHGGSIRPLDDLSEHIGKRVQIKAVDGKADWVVVESEESLK